MSKQLIIKNNNANIEYYITDFEKENRIYLDRISQINENAFFNEKIKDSVEIPYDVNNPCKWMRQDPFSLKKIFYKDKNYKQVIFYIS